jgi:dolichol-phosphate mannosyltransferase
MLLEIEANNADVVIGTRYGAGGSTGEWNKKRKTMSRFATFASRVVLKQSISDPMSGFFMIQRSVLHETVHNLSGIGFKILLDILASANKPLRVVEQAYHFRDRFAGESKLDGMVIWEYGMLLADKMLGRFLPVRFLAFSIIGGLGVLIHLTVLTSVLKGLKLSFAIAQTSAAVAAMVFNFSLNNILTYRDQRLKGLKWVKGLLSFIIACSIGALANVGIAVYLFDNKTQWILAALSGIVVGAVWNYAVTRHYTWGKEK